MVVCDKCGKTYTEPNKIKELWSGEIRECGEKSPFVSFDLCPVCAVEFCKWLSTKERKDGKEIKV